MKISGKHQIIQLQENSTEGLNNPQVIKQNASLTIGSGHDFVFTPHSNVIDGGPDITTATYAVHPVDNIKISGPAVIYLDVAKDETFDGILSRQNERLHKTISKLCIAVLVMTVINFMFIVFYKTSFDASMLAVYIFLGFFTIPCGWFMIAKPDMFDRNVIENTEFGLFSQPKERIIMQMKTPST